MLKKQILTQIEKKFQNLQNMKNKSKMAAMFYMAAILDFHFTNYYFVWSL